MAISFDFSGQVVLVTGAATGLGFAVAEAFGKAGATVALNDLSPERVERGAAKLSERGLACRGYAADVRNGTAVRGMIAQIVAELGAPDVTVASAGIYPNTPFLDIAEEEWDRVLETNLKGTFLTCQAVAKAMISAGKGGQIITMSSGAANTAFLGWSHYCSSKAAVVMLTKSMALELGEHGIRVNTVLPGYIDVPEGGAHLDEEYKRAARQANPLGLTGTPEDIANVVMMVSSPLSGFLSGTAIPVDGGASAGRLGVYPKHWQQDHQGDHEPPETGA